VLDLSSADGGALVGEDAEVIFLDEFWMIVLSPRNTLVPEFTLFNTLVPRNHPVGSRRFRIPPIYQGWFPTMYVDGDRCLGTLDRDRPLATDQTQAVFAVKLFSPDGPRVFLIVRIQTLIEHVGSMSVDACVSWDEWGRGVAVMEVPECARGGPFPLVQGVHVTLVMPCVTPGSDGSHLHPNLYTFDLSRRSWSTLLLRDEGDGTGRRVLFEDGRKLSLHGTQEMADCGFDSLGDGKFMHLVSRFCRWKSGGTLMPE